MEFMHRIIFFNEIIKLDPMINGFSKPTKYTIEIKVQVTKLMKVISAIEI